MGADAPAARHSHDSSSGGAKARTWFGFARHKAPSRATERGTCSNGQRGERLLTSPWPPPARAVESSACPSHTSATVARPRVNQGSVFAQTTNRATRGHGGG